MWAGTVARVSEHVSILVPSFPLLYHTYLIIINSFLASTLLWHSPEYWRNSTYEQPCVMLRNITRLVEADQSHLHVLITIIYRCSNYGSGCPFPGVDADTRTNSNFYTITWFSHNLSSLLSNTFTVLACITLLRTLPHVDHTHHKHSVLFYIFTRMI